MADRSRRVVILADTQTHMMPALARAMASRDHDLVIGDPVDGLEDELSGPGAKVEVVEVADDLTKEDTVQKLVDRAQDVFGGFDSAGIRTGVHGTGTILAATSEECDTQYDGTLRSAFFAPKAVLPPPPADRSNRNHAQSLFAAGLTRSVLLLWLALAG